MVALSFGFVISRVVLIAVGCGILLVVAIATGLVIRRRRRRRLEW